MMTKNLTPALIAELIGTFALIFIGAGAGALGIGGLVGVALAHGLVLVGFAYAYGHVSGAHVNPAVTLGVWLAGKMDAGRAFSYMVFQVIGGILGAVALRTVLDGVDTGLGQTLPVASVTTAAGVALSVSPPMAILIEAILTFFLVNCVLNAAVSGKAGNMAGLAIGMTLTFCILMGGPLTGASLNPARSIGPAVALGDLTNLWIYIVGPLAGAAVAAFLYRGLLKDA
jgi:aquaporin Z